MGITTGMGSFENMAPKETAWHSFTTKLSCHGVPDLGNAQRKTERTVWAVLVIIFLILLTYGVIVTTIEFIQSPIVTSIAQVGTAMIKFPKVYICPPELVDYSSLDVYTLEKIYNATHYEEPASIRVPPMNTIAGVPDIAMSGGALNSTAGLTFVDPPPLPPPPSLLQRKLSVWQKADGAFYAAAGSWGAPPVAMPGPPMGSYNLTANSTDTVPMPVDVDPPLPPLETFLEMMEREHGNETLQELFLRSGLLLDTLFEECAFQSSTFPCKNRTEPIFDTAMGTCFLTDVQEAQAKQGSGLDLVLWIPQHYYRPELLEFLPVVSGISLWIGNDFDPFSKSRILIPVGQQVRIELKKTVTRLMNAPKSATPQRCVDKQQGLTVFNVTYSVDSCQADCLQMEVLKKCNCIRPVDSRYVNAEFANISTCTAKDLVRCVSPLVDELALAASKARQDLARSDTNQKTGSFESLIPEDQELYYKCISNCERPCTYTKYGTTVSQTQLNGYGSQIMLEIAFDSLDVMYVVQHPAITPAGYISNLGGQLGIWLGASLLTVFQVLIFLVSYCCTTAARKDIHVATQRGSTAFLDETYMPHVIHGY